MKIYKIILYGGLLIGIMFSGFAQTVPVNGVGINTTNPRKTLEVAGNANVDGKVRVQIIDELTQNEDVTFLIQNQNNFVKEIDASGNGLAIAYFQEYVITNMENGIGDWVADFNTNIPSSKYVVTVISAYYNQELTMRSAEASNFAIPYISAFIKDGSWHITADYPSAANASSAVQGKWVINTFILSKAFSKALPTQTFNLNGASSGTATNAVIN